MESHHWALDSNAQDSVGSNDGTATGITYLNQAAEFDGSTISINVGSVSFGNTFTITAWIRLNETAPSRPTIMANTDSVSDMDGFAMYVLSADGNLIFKTGDGASNSQAKTNNGVINFNTWHHVAAVVDCSSGDVTLYVDGVDQTFDGTCHAGFDNNTTTLIGLTPDSRNAYKWNGGIDEVKIYGGLLTRSEVMNDLQ